MRKLQAIFIFGGLLFFGSLSLLALYAEFGLPWQYAKKEQQMQKYLEERYKEQFEVTDVYFDLMHGRSYAAYATAQKTGYQFHVQIFQNGEVESSYSSYFTDDIKDFFKPYFSGAKYFYGDFSLSKPLKQSEVLADNLAYSCWSLQVDYYTVLTDETREEELQQTLKVIQQMSADDICLEYLLVGFYGDYVQLEKEQLANIQQLTQLSLTPVEEIELFQ